MKLFFMCDPQNDEYKRGIMLGTWEEEPTVCSDCRRGRATRIEPLIMEWEKGAQVVGDFTWPGGPEGIVVGERAVEVLGAFIEVQTGEVLVQGNLSRSVDGRAGRREKGRRYSERHTVSSLRELLLDGHRLPADRPKSSLRVAASCKTCGHIGYELVGIETRKPSWNAHTGELVFERIPRREGEGLFVPEALVSERPVFKTVELGGAICTDVVRQAMQDAGLTNISFREAGETF